MADQRIEHLLRRAGFGASADDLAIFGNLSYGAAVDRLVNYELDSRRCRREDRAAGLRRRRRRTAPFSPNTIINDARQRWLFRMVHSEPAAAGEDDALLAQPLRDRLHEDRRRAAGAPNAHARYMAAKASEDPAGQQGQIEMLRDNALGNFRDLLVAVAKDPAMLVWLDGHTNTKAKPQENFGREIMELFTLGVGNYTEADVYAAARVFTGWNLRSLATAADGTAALQFVYNAEPARHEREDVQLSDLRRRQHDDSRRVGSRPGCRTASI